MQQELRAVPLFRAWTPIRSDGDPICGHLNWFEHAGQMTVEDLGRLRGFRPDDICYLSSTEPAQLMALVRWMKGLPPEQRPHCVLEFGSDPGIDVEPGARPDQYVMQLRDYRLDPRPMFYRFAARFLQDDDLARFHMITFNAGTSAVYTQLLGKPVGALPLPQFSNAQIINRAGRRPITVAALRHQRPDKGYHLMPQIARLLLAYEPEVRLLIHNCIPEQMPQVQAELRAHAAVEPRVTLNGQIAGPALWRSLLDQSDVILCPYEPKRYAASYSAVAAEAVACGIPLVVPARTSLSRLLADFGQPGEAFETFDPPGIVAATRRVVADFDAFAGKAAAAAERWIATMGVTNMVSGLLALCQQD
ncbi:MAG: glycosyltransferase [Rhodopila sp.]